MKYSHRMGGKLDYAWMGPYTVVDVLPKGRYRLRGSNGLVLKKIYNSTLLKPYLEPSDQQNLKPQKQLQTNLHHDDDDDDCDHVRDKSSHACLTDLHDTNQATVKSPPTGAPQTNQLHLNILDSQSAWIDVVINDAQELLRVFPTEARISEYSFGSQITVCSDAAKLCSDSPHL